MTFSSVENDIDITFSSYLSVPATYYQPESTNTISISFIQLK